ncbi:MarR family winged helix-turn-helix transcriptional regulator [Nocardioides insulae]|uniref:MarR family winged helix-turn-helix transcriptional regulator n=1 Tax=Nocardioides insulae TaxID=394734 RepID=UPI0004216577|nr:MarR family transcriptional regulator [Nocardioides insulae]
MSGHVSTDPAGPPSPEWHEATSLRTLRALLEAATQVRRVVARRAGLSETELAALEQLSHGPIGPAALARRLDVTSAASTGIVDRLSHRGHAERRPDAEDRRRTEIHLTASGRSTASRELAPMFVRLARLEDEFEPDELDAINRYLEGALRALESVGADRSPEDPQGDFVE